MIEDSARIFNTSSSEYIAMTDKKPLVDNMVSIKTYAKNLTSKQFVLSNLKPIIILDFLKEKIFNRFIYNSYKRA